MCVSSYISVMASVLGEISRVATGVTEPHERTLTTHLM